MEQRKQGKAGLPFFLLTFSLAKQRKSKSPSAKPDVNLQRNKVKIMIAKTATTHFHNITLRNHKKPYNPTHNKIICKHNIIQTFTLIQTRTKHG